MLPLPGHPTAGVCCSGGDARKLSGQSLRKQGLEQSRAWWQMTVLGPTLALPSAGLPAAACGGRSLPLGRRLLPAPLPPGEVPLAPISVVSQPWLSSSAEGRAVTPRRGCRQPQMLLRADGSPCPMHPGTAGLLARGAQELPPHG